MNINNEKSTQIPVLSLLAQNLVERLVQEESRGVVVEAGNASPTCLICRDSSLNDRVLLYSRVGDHLVVERVVPSEGLEILSVTQILDGIILLIFVEELDVFEGEKQKGLVELVLHLLASEAGEVTLKGYFIPLDFIEAVGVSLILD